MDSPQDSSWIKKFADVERKIKDLRSLRSRILEWTKQARYSARIAGPEKHVVLMQECQRVSILAARCNKLLTQAYAERALLCKRVTKKSSRPDQQIIVPNILVRPPPGNACQILTLGTSPSAADSTGRDCFCCAAKHSKRGGVKRNTPKYGSVNRGCNFRRAGSSPNRNCLSVH